METREQTCMRIIECSPMLDAIRLFKVDDATVENYRELLGISRSTADNKYMNVLRGDPKADIPSLLEKSGRKTLIRRDAAFFLGISIGSSHIRVSILGLDFESYPLEELLTRYPRFNKLKELPGFQDEESERGSFCYSTPAKEPEPFERIREVVSCVVATCLNQADDSRSAFPLMGIGLAVTGPVDYDATLWCAAPRFTDVREISLIELIGYTNFHLAKERGIFLSLDNNAKSAIVSEYQFLKERSNGRFKEDVALLYIGTGLGTAAVIDQALMRGSHNLSGEAGHLRILSENGVKSIEDCLETDSDYARYLPYVLTAINCILGVEHVIFIGHSLRRNKELIPSLIENRLAYTITSTQRYCKLEIGRGVSETAAMGAAIEAYHCMCNYSTASPNARINLAHTISWPRASAR